MASILKAPFNAFADPDTIALELPLTTPIANGDSRDPGWDARVNAPCDRTPTISLEPSTHAARVLTELRRNATTDAAVDDTSLPATASESAESVVNTPEAVKPQATSSTPSNILHGRYLLDRAIAAGGSAVIYRARDLQRGDESGAAMIAVKLLKQEARNDAAAIERLKREYAYTLKLSHPNIVRVFDLDECKQHGWFMTMELVEGDSLATLMRRIDTPMSKQRRLSIIQACGRVLAFAHEHGVMHCDFKPSNVMISSAGHVRVLDFGADCVKHEATGDKHRAAATTPAYASPQLLKGDDCDVRDDLFSLACVTYELLTGRHPFGMINAAQLHHCEIHLVHPSQLSNSQWQSLQSALSLDREHRQASVAAFMKEFTSVKSHATWWLSAAAAALVVLGLTLWLSRSSAPSSAQAPTPTITGNSTINEQKAAISAAPSSSAPVAATFVPTLSGAVSPVVDTSAAVLKPKVSPVSNDKLRPRINNTAINNNSARSTVAFDQSRVVVSDLAIAAALTIKRTNADDDERIQWRTLDGTAHAGIDYDPAAGAAVFRNGQTHRTIYVNLKKNIAAQGDRHFTVELSSGNLKPASSVDVTIKDSTH